MIMCNKSKIATKRKALADSRRKKVNEENHKIWVKTENSSFEHKKTFFEKSARENNQFNMKSTLEFFETQFENLKNQGLSQVKIDTLEKLKEDVDITYQKINLKIDEAVQETSEYVLTTFETEKNHWWTTWREDIEKIYENLIPKIFFQELNYGVKKSCWIYQDWHDLQQSINVSIKELDKSWSWRCCCKDYKSSASGNKCRLEKVKKRSLSDLYLKC